MKQKPPFHPSRSDEKEKGEEASEQQSRLGKTFYLNYGQESLHPDLSPGSVLDFLNQALPASNRLTSARTKKALSRRPDTDYTKVCSYCALPLSEASYERMEDGSIRCEACARTGVESTEELSSLYLQKRREFESLFATRLPDGIHIRMTSEVPEGTGRMVPAPLEDPVHHQPLGVAVSGEDGYTIWLRPGISRLAVMYVMICLFTSLWQQEHWDLDQLTRLAKEEQNPDLFEAVTQGMSEWAAMQVMLVNGEKSFARQNRERMMTQASPGAAGFEMMEKTYPLIEFSRQLPRHPFHERVPLDLKRMAARLSQS